MKKLVFEDGVIYQGDCLEVLRRLGEDSVDLIFTSPPYRRGCTFIP